LGGSVRKEWDMRGFIGKAGRIVVSGAAASGLTISAAMVFASSAGAHAPPTVTSIAVSGTPAKPQIIVKGSGFGATAPAANPSAHPNGQDGCPAFPSSPTGDIKRDGYDYGTNGLWLEDTTAGWRAGDYVPTTETDCIGLRITSWSRTEIKFKPGTAYDNSSLEGFTWILTSGDSVSVDVLGTTATTTY
jgi:hypothetical protein